MEHNYRFLDAPDIEAGRIKIDSEKVSMVIIDLMISPEAGFETYKEYIKTLVEKDILVHLLIEEGETSEEIINLIGISDDFSVKPLRSDELLSKIESLLHLKEMETKVLNQYEKLHFLEEGLIDGIEKNKCETELFENLRDFMLEMKAKMREKEAILQESESKYRAIFENTGTAMTIDEEDTTISMVNAEAEKLSGYPREEIEGKMRWTDFIVKDDLERLKEYHLLRRIDPKAVPGNYEFRLIDKDGNVKDIFATVALIPGTKKSVASLVDITERKQAEEKLQTYQEQLRSLASQLSLVEERERLRIATDIHDHIGQTLAYCKIKLGSLQESGPPDFAKDIDEIRKLIEKTIQYTRSLTFELSPPILYELDFEAAVEWFGEQIQKKHGILFEFEDDKQSKLIDDKARTLLFQAVRELLVNVTKHAQAHKVRVSIQRNGDNIRINIEDDGVGFDTSKIGYCLRGDKGFGFFSIHERLKCIGGYLDVKSGAGCGTRATLVAPLKLVKI
ncbi:MAG: PAS domain S-box protein [Nitrospira sp.]|nr:PAS domain S-box protein [Nitrospira sp.]